MAVKHGNLSINSDNIFPIIKKWLISDHDILCASLYQTDAMQLPN